MSVDDAPTAGAFAAQTHVVVIGGGIAGLVAAWECAKIGMRVTLVEASTALGGTIRGQEVAGHTLDVGVECFSTHGGIVREMLEDLGFGDEIVAPADGTSWVSGLPGGVAAPLPAGGVLGIPANPFMADVLRVLGTRGAWRAYLDRIRPVLTIGREHNLGKLVRSRMGERVLSRLVAPVTRGVHGMSPDDIDVDVAAPGLNGALTRTGSLTGAVGQLQGDGTRGPAVLSLRGGMHQLIPALEARLLEFGVDVQTGTACIAVQRRDDRAGWRIERIAAPGAQQEDAVDEADAEIDEDLAPLDADFVIVATSEHIARNLLGSALAAAPAPRDETIIETVTLVIDEPALDAAPRGLGVFPVAGTSRAVALLDETAKWPWLAERMAADAPHRHVVRVMFGAAGEAPATGELDLDGATAMAVAEASTMLGVPLAAAQIVDSHRARFAQARPASALGHEADASATRAALKTAPGVVAVGAWLAGSGLARVISDAREQAEVVRQAALWGASGANEG